ncbi:sulfite dehydrogenase [Falsiroseomonas sp. HW251]|uniref:sulfite dehydrogenase n=1 Tax=Falsiroseomonas sp. HW251 TaxID=3390998 RepID=UPI003D32094B
MDRVTHTMLRQSAEPVAANGLLHRRLLVSFGAAAGASLYASGDALATSEPRLSSPASMVAPGTPFRAYGMPAKAEEGVQRGIPRPFGDLAPGTGPSNTPLHRLEGIITPIGLHYERHHNGVPDINRDAHRLLIHGLVERPLTFGVPDLLRYQMTSRLLFIECGGNSMQYAAREAPQLPFHMINGRVSCAEWTGVPLRTLLEEAGIDPRGRWVLAESADGAGYGRSLPVEKAMSDTLVALYQNGERVRPENGYPIRLVVPGWIGAISVKWLRRIKVTEGPTQTRDETSRYTHPRPDGLAWQFKTAMDVKSLICRPARGLAMTGPGFYEISGIAWSGHGRVARVEVSADGGASWAEAALQDPVLPLCLTRFRIPWRWDGAPAVLMSRATDDQGNVQPSREQWLAQYAPGQPFGYNATVASRIAANGEVFNAYA